MKISVSLPEDDVRFIDEYGAQANVPTRSAVIHEAVTMLRSSSMEAAYTAAWDEWAGSEDAAYWDTTSADGLADAQG
jgi:Arc/MetJ-type ribon-helix-helix transcriptional regulator